MSCRTAKEFLYFREFFSSSLSRIFQHSPGALTFIAPAFIAKYSPKAAEKLRLANYNSASDNIFSFSATAWSQGISSMVGTLHQQYDKIPASVSAPILTYAGYKSIETIVEKVIRYPASDYATWTALNLQQFLKEIYPHIIPEAYKNDPVLNEVRSKEGNPIRSPFIINNEVEFGNVYEEHILKHILFNQRRNKKMCCPKDGKTEIQPSDIQRDYVLSDRIELRLLLLDAYAYKKGREARS